MTNDFLSVCVDVLSEGIWTVFEELQDRELNYFAKALLRTVLQSWADSTKQNYVYAFQTWKSWAASKAEVKVFQIKAAHLALYLQHVSEVTQSKSAVEEAVNAANWMLELAGILIVREAQIVSVTLNSLLHVCGHEACGQEGTRHTRDSSPVVWVSGGRCLSHRRAYGTNVLAGFCNFLRFDEQVKLKAFEIVFEKEKMMVKITSSKTD